MNAGVPYVVAGGGGYHNLHTMAPGIGQPPHPIPNSDVTLDAFDDHDWGWLALTIDKTSISGSYTAVSKTGASRVADTFVIPLKDGPPPPPPPTNAQLLDQALGELEQTTVGYRSWGSAQPTPESHWAKALDLLTQLRHNL